MNIISDCATGYCCYKYVDNEMPPKGCQYSIPQTREETNANYDVIVLHKDKIYFFIFMFFLLWWHLLVLDSLGTALSVLIKGVSSFQGYSCTHLCQEPCTIYALLIKGGILVSGIFVHALLCMCSWDHALGV